jgi:hypothetical protein
MTQHFRPVWLSGMPRSGTTWLGQVIAAHPDARLKHCPLFSYEFKGRCNEFSTRADWQSFLGEVYETRGEFLDQEHLRSKGLVPHFEQKNAAPGVLAIKSNRFHHLSHRIVELLPEVRWVAIVRHPCATIHSWLSNPTEFPSGADVGSEWRSGRCRKTAVGEFWGFDDWVQVTLGQIQMASAFPDRVRLLRYEAIDRFPQEGVARLFSFLGLSEHPQVTDFVRASKSSHSSNHRSVFKAPANSSRWRLELEPSIQAEIEGECVRRGLGEFLLEPSLEDLFYHANP